MENATSKGRVIVTYGRSIIALAIAHSLGKRGVEVIGCDDVELTVLQFSKYVQDTFLHRLAKENPEGYLEDLIENIERYKPENGEPYVLIPSFRDATIIAKHRERLEKHIIVAAPDISSIDAVLSKAAFAKTAEANELPIPQTLVADSVEELQDRENFPEPAIVKPPDSHGGRGIRICQTKEEAVRYCHEIVDAGGEMPVVQAAVPGEDYCFAALCDHGQLVAHMAYQNLQQFPIDKGQGVVRKTVDDAPFRASAEKLLAAVNWHGIAQIDFRWDGQGEPMLIEVNPRFWAGLVHSVESGVDFPWLLFQIMTGQSPEPNEAKVDVTTNTPGLRWLSALQDCIDSNESFEELGRHWENFTAQLEGKRWEAAWRSFADFMTTEIDTESTKAKWRQLKKQSENAHSDLLLEDDPQAALGLLFVVSSLIRHGDLPEEFKV
ncbi:ATP-grasp domain-containing protein [Cerasicoccus fimbriatus]|uniref:carboxylate--amine ligase n=1 Tax=Cerasicoccus fimbriatus TaxID=3014554 RepID=UPI0022B4EB9A|nr:ATP-grasp domain-containing protein [Cerasicoccus sp. TK19100]